MSAADLLAGSIFSFPLLIIGSIAILLTRNYRSTLRSQLKLFWVAFAIRFLSAVLLYAGGLHAKIVGDGDDVGWLAGVGLLDSWTEQGVGLLELPVTLLGAFNGHHRGYSYLLGVYFFITRVPSQFSAAALNCFIGALTAVFAYRIARIHFSEWVAVRTGWWTCFFPSMIVWSAQTVKEPVVILLEATALYGCLRLRADRFSLNRATSSVKYIVLSAISILILASMRFYAAYITGFAVLFTLLLPQIKRRKMAVGSALGTALIAVPLLSYTGALHKDSKEFDNWDLKRTQQLRYNLATGEGSGSGVVSNYDMTTSRGLGLATLFGAVHLLLAPFPWQFGGSVRMVLTLPEMVVWWFLVFAGLLPGLKHAIRHRLGDILPLLLFLLGLGLIYSMTFGNIGLVYRQRAQLLPYLLIFAASGMELRKLRRVRRGAESDRFKTNVNNNALTSHNESIKFLGSIK